MISRQDLIRVNQTKEAGSMQESITYKKEDKIQTGLRIPEGQYERLTVLSKRMGVSLNALVLVLIDTGLGIIESQTAE